MTDFLTGRFAVYVLTGAAGLVLCLASLGTPEAVGANPPGKLVRSKQVLLKEVDPPEVQAYFNFNPFWRKPGQGIKRAWVRFSAGGTAKGCRMKYDYDPETDEEIGQEICQSSYKIYYGYSGSCRTTETALNIGRYKRKEVATAANDSTFSFVKVWPVKLVKDRISCGINAVVRPEPYEYSFLSDFSDPFLRGRALVKVELFLKK